MIFVRPSFRAGHRCLTPRFLGISLLTALTAFTLVPTAHAQTYTNPFSGNSFNNPMSATMDMLIMQGMQRRMLLRSNLRQKGYSDARLEKMTEEEMMAALGIKNGKSSSSSSSKSTTAAKKPAVPNTPATRFQPSGKRMLLDDYVNSLGGNAEEKKAYREIFTHIFDNFEAEAKKKGAAHDVAGAASFYAMTNYSLYHDGDAGAIAAADKASNVLVKQFQSLFDTPELRKAPHAQKQKMYETLVLLSAYMLTIQQVAQGQEKPEIRQTIVKLGGDGLKYLLKVEPGRVKLNEAGISVTPE
jgi:hypothetical protein